MNYPSVLEHLKQKGYAARWFDTGAAAADWLCGELHGTTVGFGGSVTSQELGLYEKLGADNQVYWHWKAEDRLGAQKLAAGADVYILSANALAETGEIVNIDGNGNRLASAFYGHKRVIFIVGVNKLAPDLPAAIERARNVASPLNARRLKLNTPCAKADPPRCFDCASPDRICCGLSVLYKKMGSIPQMDVLLIGETLGY